MAPSKTVGSKRKRAAEQQHSPEKVRRRLREPARPKPPAKCPYEQGEEEEKENTEEEKGGLFSAVQILDETRTKYYIEWEGNDPATGQRYKPTWEPHGNANAALIADWKAKKAAKRAAKSGAAAAKITPKKKITPTKKTPREQYVPKKNARVVESSPESQLTPAPSEILSASSPTELSERVSSVAPAPESKGQIVLVQPEPASDFDREDYQRYSQTALTQPSSSHAASPEDSQTIDSNFHPASSAWVVQESQGANENSDYVPSTQTASSEEQQSVSVATGQPGHAPQGSFIVDFSIESALQAVSQTPTAQPNSVEIAETPSQQRQSDKSQEVYVEQSSAVPGTDQATEGRQEQSQELFTPKSTHSPRRTEQPEQDEPSQPATVAEALEEEVPNELTSVVEETEEIPLHSHTIEEHPKSASKAEPGSLLVVAGSTQIAGEEQPSSVEEQAIEGSSTASLLTQFIEEQEQSQSRVVVDEPLPVFAEEELSQSQGATTVDEPDSVSALNRCIPVEDTRSGLSPTPSSSGIFQERVGQLSPVSVISQLDHEERHDSSQEDETISAPVSQACERLPKAAQIQNEQQAQIIPEEPLSSIEYSVGGIRETTELYSVVAEVERRTESPDTDTDTDAPTSVRQPTANSPALAPPQFSVGNSFVGSSSPPPQPPSRSLGTLDSNAPPRPQTPIDFTFGPPPTTSNMDSQPVQSNHDPDDFEALVEEHLSKHRAAAAAAATIKSPKRVLKTVSSPKAAPGTRSPSTIPERAPQRPMPSSLRTTALANSAAEAAAEDVTTPRATPSTRESTSVEPPASVSTDTATLLNDDLELVPEEYIVPLALTYRQRKWYVQAIKEHDDMIMQFLEHPEEATSLAEVEKAYNRLRNMETHSDLCYSEAKPLEELERRGDMTFAKWSIDNSCKFKFMNTLLNELREQDRHILLVTETSEDGLLMDIIETFLKDLKLNYSVRGRKANMKDVMGKLRVTVLAADTNDVVHPPSAIICLRGALDSASIRKKEWGKSRPGSPPVPIIHLEVPRALGHIERYIGKRLTPKRRLRTLLACLFQQSNVLGRPMVEATPSAVEAAGLVAKFIVAYSENIESAKWPLPPLGSINEMITYHTMESQELIDDGTTTPTPISTKRPLDAEDLEPTKRMRMTPQPLPGPESSAAGAAAEVTHISDSMPNASQQEEIERLTRLLKEKDLLLEQNSKDMRTMQIELKAKDNRSLIFEQSADARQNDFEELKKELLDTRGKLQESERRTELIERQRQRVQENWEKQRDENRDLRTQLDEANQAGLKSDDEKVAEISRLRIDLAAAKEAEARATKSIKSTEDTMAYLRDQYTAAQDSAATLTAENRAVQKEVERLTKVADETKVQLKQISYDKQTELARKKCEQLTVQNASLKSQLERKDEELSKARQGRQGVGTRQSSVPRSPRVGGAGSRAASPMTGGRDRVANLRGM